MELAAYLVALPRDTLDALYESRWTCLAVLRSLPPLGSQYLLRMLLVDAPVTQGAAEASMVQGLQSTDHAYVTQWSVRLRAQEAAFILHATISIIPAAHAARQRARDPECARRNGR